MSLPTAIKNDNWDGDSWGTPMDLWGEIRERFFPGVIKIFDPCPNRSRMLNGAYSTILETDGLKCNWDYFNFINPPFSDIRPWVEEAMRIYAVGVGRLGRDAKSVLLVPVRCDQPWWHLFASSARIVFIRGRVNYVSAKSEKTSGASFASCLLIFGAGHGVEFWFPECHKNRKRAARCA